MSDLDPEEAVRRFIDEVMNQGGLEPGDRLHLSARGPRPGLERQADGLAELRDLACDVPRTRSFVDELLEERRAAAAHE